VNMSNKLNILSNVSAMAVVTLDENSFDIMCTKLATDILASGYSPDVVVSIATGGDYVAAKMRNKMDANFYSVKKTRSSTKTKNSLFGRFLFAFIRLLPYFILNILRKIEHYFLISKPTCDNSSADNLFSLSFVDELSGAECILIVDDAIDSGKTIHAVRESIRAVVKEKVVIKVASLVVTTEDPIVYPDYYMYENTLVRFPWSKDFKK